MFFGTVKWFNTKRGYGFIIPDEGGKDVFLHISALHKAGLDHLEERSRIGYILAHSNGKIVADNLTPLAHEDGGDDDGPPLAPEPRSKRETIYA